MISILLFLESLDKQSTSYLFLSINFKNKGLVSYTHLATTSTRISVSSWSGT